MKKILLFLAVSMSCLSICAIDHVVGVPTGFAAYNYNLTGGSGGTVVNVYTASELATALDTEGPMIILVNGEIKISSELPCRSNKTIVGVGDNAVIRGQGIALNKRENVIFQNIHFMQSGDDLIKLNGATHIWVDHCSFSDGGADPSSSDFDGTLDICKGSDFITVSYCHFFNHSKNVLMSSSDGSGNTDTDKLRTTFHHCWFDGTYQRNPRVRFGIVHVYNNYYTNNSIYSIASCEKAKVLVEDNYFKDCPHPGYGVSGYADSGAGYLWTKGSNIFVNSNETEFNNELNSPPSNPTVPYDPSFYYQYTSIDANEIPAIIMQLAGAGKLSPDPDAATLQEPENLSQTVQLGNNMVDIIFIWGGAATDVEFVGLPSEIEIVRSGKTATLKGTPSETFNYSVSAIGGNNTVTLRGTITVTDDPLPPGLNVIADWYPFQEAGISLDFIASNGTVDPNRSGSDNCTKGALNLNDNSKKMTLTLPSLGDLKMRINPTGTRTLKLTYGPTGTENTWSKEYKSGYYEVDITREIPNILTLDPIILNIINDRSSSGNLYIHDLFVAVYSATRVNIPAIERGNILSEKYYTVSGIHVENANSSGIFIKKIMYENGDCETVKIIR